MKKLKYIVVALVAVFATSCGEPEDLVTADAIEGVRYTSSGSSGALLGLPTEDGFNFLETGLTYTVRGMSDNIDEVASYTVYKTYKGNVQEVVTSNELPFTVEFAGISDFLEGYSDTEDDLVIGDNFTIYTEATLNSGSIIKDVAANFSVNVACLSDLGGTWSGTEQLFDDNCDGGALVPFSIEITPVAGQPGTYLVNNVTDLFFGGNVCTPADICGYITDVCGTITVTSGVEAGCAYGVNATGTGSVNEDATVMTLTVYNDATASEQEIVFER